LFSSLNTHSKMKTGLQSILEGSHERNTDMDIKGSIALVTGGNRGLGKAFVLALLDAGAQKVYVGARQLTETGDPRLQPLKLDVTNADDIAAAVEACQDVSLLINNAGVSRGGSLIGAGSMEGIREDIETNYLGTLAMCRAFAPVLQKNGGGVLVNMLSVLSWFINPSLGSYSVSKAAEWTLTDGIRMELRTQGTLVVGVHAGYIDTDLAARVSGPKARPEDVARATMEGIIAGHEEVLADGSSQQIRTTLDNDRHALSRQMQQLWDSSKVGA
jgi:NAD(P)-dependent dehydrogenase (short-subunit alcohol dehydrogenase family)